MRNETFKCPCGNTFGVDNWYYPHNHTKKIKSAICPVCTSTVDKRKNEFKNRKSKYGKRRNRYRKNGLYVPWR